MHLFERIAVGEIISRHIKTFYDPNTGNICKFQLFLFYVLPLPIIFASVFFSNHSIDDKLGNLFFQAFAIIGGFLFNSLVMLADKRKDYDDSKKVSERVTLIEETYSNTSFSVLVCFAIVFLAGIAVGTNDGGDSTSKIHPIHIWRILLTSIVYWLSVVFVLTLGMVLKRLDKIFRTISDKT